MKKAKIVIIGGGVVGASVAYHLAKRGCRDVLILERENEQGRGSTGAATGGIRSQFATEINIRMSLYSLEFFRKWEFDCSYEPRGYLFFATNYEQLEFLSGGVRLQKFLGVQDVEIVDTEFISRLVPGINCDDIVGGSFGRSDGFIDPLAVMRGFTEGALSGGARIQFGTESTALETKNGRITAVQTSKGRVQCDAAVLCAGAWARGVAETAGIDLPVEPQRRQIAWVRAKNPLPPGLPMVIDLGSGFHFRPARDFRKPPGKLSHSGNQETDLLFAYPDPDEPISTKTKFDDDFIKKVYHHAEHRARFLFDTEVVKERCRAGLYENTPDHHAILGGCEIEGLYFANGFSGHGVMHSPATGRALAEIMLDGEASFLDVSSLSIERFEKGSLIKETTLI